MGQSKGIVCASLSDSIFGEKGGMRREEGGAMEEEREGTSRPFIQTLHSSCHGIVGEGSTTVSVDRTAAVLQP